MSQESPDPARPTPRDRRRRRDRIVKATFVAAAVIIVLVLWWQQRRGPDWPGWDQDLPATLARAKTEKRPVLALFLASPPGHFAREFRRKTLAKKENRDAIEQGKFLLVRITLDQRLTGEIARRYRIRRLPTLLLLDPDGTERNRRAGEAIVPEVPFRNGFLDATAVTPAPEDTP